MLRNQIEAALARDPFVPLRLHVSDGATIDVPFQHVVVFVRDGVLVFKGVKKPGSHVAKSYEFISFERVERIEPRPGRGNGKRRRKAS